MINRIGLRYFVVLCAVGLAYQGSCTYRVSSLESTPTSHGYRQVLPGISIYTLKPSALKHFLCSSISLRQSSCSGPFSAMHKSLGSFVAGQAQQIFFPGLVSLFFSLSHGMLWLIASHPHSRSLLQQQQPVANTHQADQESKNSAERTPVGSRG